MKPVLERPLQNNVITLLIIVANGLFVFALCLEYGLPNRHSGAEVLILSPNNLVRLHMQTTLPKEHQATRFNCTASQTLPPSMDKSFQDGNQSEALHLCSFHSESTVTLNEQAITYGETALTQFRKFIDGKSPHEIRELTHRGQWPKASKYTYKFNWQTTDTHICAVISELTFGQLSSGGSYFYVTQQYRYHNKHYVGLCSFSDLLNGTYLACCPIVSTCSKIVVQRKFVEFHGFTSYGQKFRDIARKEKKIILNTTICFNNSRHERIAEPANNKDKNRPNKDKDRGNGKLSNSKSDSGIKGNNSGNFVSSLGDNENKSFNIFDRSDNNTETSRYNIGRLSSYKIPSAVLSWEITFKQGNPVCHTMHQGLREITTNIKQICQNLRDFGHIIMIGASHLRYIYEYLWRKCPAVRNRFSFKSVYMVNMYTQEAVVNILSYFTGVSQTSVIIFQTGSHDAKNSPPYTTLIDSFTLYKHIIHQFDNFGQEHKNVFVCVLPPPPNPLNSKHCVSNAVAAAFNHMVQQMVSETANIKYYDFFSPLYPCLNDIPLIAGNYNHYFQHGQGIGKQIWFDLLQQICEAKLHH